MLLWSCPVDGEVARHPAEAENTVAVAICVTWGLGGEGGGGIKAPRGLIATGAGPTRWTEGVATYQVCLLVAWLTWSRDENVACLSPGSSLAAAACNVRKIPPGVICYFFATHVVS